MNERVVHRTEMASTPQSVYDFLEWPIDTPDALERNRLLVQLYKAAADGHTSSRLEALVDNDTLNVITDWWNFELDGITVKWANAREGRAGILWRITQIVRQDRSLRPFTDVGVDELYHAARIRSGPPTAPWRDAVARLPKR